MWDPVQLKDMSKEGKDLLVPQVTNYVEKYNLIWASWNIKQEFCLEHTSKRIIVSQKDH